MSLTLHNLNTQSASIAALTGIDSAIDTVNHLRSNLGAVVNRIEHAINNLTVSSSNQQAAESQIRDVDFAEETTMFTRNQILVQSATAMLAQANITPQSVLQLLGG
jgi:flagellin